MKIASVITGGKISVLKNLSSNGNDNKVETPLKRHPRWHILCQWSEPQDSHLKDGPRDCYAVGFPGVWPGRGRGRRWRDFERIKRHLCPSVRACPSHCVLVDSDQNADGVREGKRRGKAVLRQRKDEIRCIRSLGLVLLEESLSEQGTIIVLK